MKKIKNIIIYLSLLFGPIIYHLLSEVSSKDLEIFELLVLSSIHEEDKETSQLILKYLEDDFLSNYELLMINYSINK